MDNFLVRLFTTIGVIWLVEIILKFTEMREPANKIIFGITVFIMVFWLLFGYIYFFR